MAFEQPTCSPHRVRCRQHVTTMMRRWVSWLTKPRRGGRSVQQDENQTGW
jgi:hypothetical protein